MYKIIYKINNFFKINSNKIKLYKYNNKMFNCKIIKIFSKVVNKFNNK